MQQTNLEQLCDVIMTLCDQICAMNSDSSESKRPNQGLVRFNHPPPPINHCYVVNVSNAGHKMQVCLNKQTKKNKLLFFNSQKLKYPQKNPKNKLKVTEHQGEKEKAGMDYINIGEANQSGEIGYNEGKRTKNRK